MAIKGSLKEASLPDVIQLLFLGRRTGCLAVADRQNFGTIYFDEGKIVYASIVNRRDRLGDTLVRSGQITPEQLRAAVDRQHGDREHKLGEILIELGAMTRSQLEAYMRLQIEEAVYYLFTWSSGTFNFEAGERPEHEDILVRLNAESLLLEGARRIDEWSLIEKKIPSLDIIFAIDAAHLAHSAPELSEEQRQILPLLDGTRDVQQIVDESGLVEFAVGKAIYGLITAGYAHRVGTTSAVRSEVNDGRVDEHRNLGVAFYKAGMHEESEREFRRVSELRPSDGAAPFYSGCIALRQGRWADAVAAFRRVCDVAGARPVALHNLAVALEQLGRLDEADAACAEAVARAPSDQRIAMGFALTAIRRGDFAAAETRLARVRELLDGRPVPVLWSWAAALVALGQGNADGAMLAARAGAADHPRSAVLQNNLAALLELSGDLAGAESALQAALAEDPSIPQVSKNLADLYYRKGRYDDARQAYERAAKLSPDLGDDLYFKLGNLAYKRRDLDSARASWQRAADLNPSHALARSNLEMLELAR